MGYSFVVVERVSVLTNLLSYTIGAFITDSQRRKEFAPALVAQGQSQERRIRNRH